MRKMGQRFEPKKVNSRMNFDLQAIQSDLKAAKLQGWLFYDFRGRDPIALHILKLPPGMRTRRWFYFVPAKGTPKKLVHKIESESLAALPGETFYYAGQDELRKNLATILRGAKHVAMQYSPKNEIPYVAMVDAGTIELVRSAGAKVVSSADLVQKYEACWTPQQLESHLTAGASVDRIVREAFQLATKAVRENKPVTEYDLKQWILQEFDVSGLTTEEGPDVAVNAHASDPHYGKYFFHRTGHSIGESVHGNGVNMDGMETHDVRHLIPGTCNSIEPGIYLPEFGIRSEVNVYIGEREARVTGAVQQEILPLLA